MAHHVAPGARRVKTWILLMAVAATTSTLLMATSATAHHLPPADDGSGTVSVTSGETEYVTHQTRSDTVTFTPAQIQPGDPVDIVIDMVEVVYWKGGPSDPCSVETTESDNTYTDQQYA